MLIVVGSRREGNSLYLANKIKEQLASSRIYPTIIIPGNQRIHLCTGCLDCDSSGVCDFTDDMKDNIELVKKEDIIVFITPTRWNLLSGDLKIFMDRLNPLCARKELKGKKLVAVSIAYKGKETYSSEAAISSIRAFGEAAGMDLILSKTFNNCLNNEDLRNHEEEINSFIKELEEKIS